MSTTTCLTPDELLTTTRAVRRKLDFSRPVDPVLIEQCLAIAQQAPSGGNQQDWGFVVVTDPGTRAALANLYRRARDETSPTLAGGETAAYLTSLPGRAAMAASWEAQAVVWGGIAPTIWSFMLAARARGLGTCWTTIHLRYEQEAAAILGIPYPAVAQAALIPVAHVVGDPFKPARRSPLATVV